MIVWLLSLSCGVGFAEEASSFTPGLTLEIDQGSNTCAGLGAVTLVNTLMNNELDGRTCIEIGIGGVARTNYMRTWCVSDTLMYMRVYVDPDLDNCIHNTKFNAFPIDSGGAATLLYEAFLPEGVCAPAFYDNAGAGAVPNVLEAGGNYIFAVSNTFICIKSY
jgi:hypothetical protein